MQITNKYYCTTLIITNCRNNIVVHAKTKCVVSLLLFQRTTPIFTVKGGCLVIHNNNAWLGWWKTNQIKNGNIGKTILRNIKINL